MSETSTLPLQARRRTGILLLGCCLFFAVLAGQYWLKIQHARFRSAFLRWNNQLLDLGHGIDIWAVHEYPNPPIMALVLMPLAQLPPVVGAMAWFLLKTALTLLAIRWVWRMADGWNDPMDGDGAGEGTGKLKAQTMPAWASLAGLLLALGPIEGDLTHGNVNLFILFLLTGGLYGFTRGRDLQSGLLIGSAIACKLTPLLFVPYFVWKRAWIALAGCGVSLVVLWGVVPGWAFGFEANAGYFASWVDRMVVPYVMHGKVTSEHQNQSLPGLVHRLLTHSPSTSARVGTEYFAREYHNVADLSPDAAGKIVLLLMAAYALLICWTCRTSPALRRDWRLAAEFSLILLGMLLLSERTWKHHCVTLLLPGAVLAHGLAGPWRRTWPLFGALAASSVLMVSGSSGLSPAHARIGDLAQVYGCYTWSILILVAATVWRMARARSTLRNKGLGFRWVGDEI